MTRDRIGTTVGKYRLLDLLAEEALSRTYLAEDEQSHARVAVKILRERHARHPERAARFLEMARALCAIDDENVVRVYEVIETEEGDCGCATELLYGELLHTLLAREAPLERARAIDIVRQIARGAAAAGAVTHEVRTFGSADVLLAVRGARKDCVKLMTLGCDVPAWGRVGREVCAGVPLPAELGKLLSRCATDDEASRPSDMREVVRLVERALERSRPVRGEIRVASKPRRRHGAMFAAGVSIAACAIGGAVWMEGARPQSSRPIPAEPPSTPVLERAVEEEAAEPVLPSSAPSKPTPASMPAKTTTDPAKISVRTTVPSAPKSPRPLNKAAPPLRAAPLRDQNAVLDPFAE